MIELVNVSKEYISKSKIKKRALKDVSLKFPDKGLCVIVGKSGSGKTTLLNILGGLDQKFSGTYRFLDKKMTTAKDYSHLRRDHIGFVFQDFNLVDDLTIYENLDLGTRFSKTENGNKITEVLEKVGLPGFEDRYPSECSGGEQQRITVARTLLKDASVLIADEPTGNLDKKTAIQIFNLFKEISKSKLVIIVTHDNNLADEFSDYKISIEDGQIVANTLPQNSVVGEYTEKKLKAIDNKIAVKMAWHEFTRKKGVAILNTFLIMLCFLVLAFSINVFRFRTSDIHYNYIKDNGYKYFNFSSITGADANKLKNNGAKLVEQSKDSIYFLSKKQAEEFGVKFYESENTLELAPNVFYISDNLANSWIRRSKTIFKGDEEIMLDPLVNSPTDLIGAYCEDDSKGICGGVFYSNTLVPNDYNEIYDSLWLRDYITTPQLSYFSRNQTIVVKSNAKSSAQTYFNITPLYGAINLYIDEQENKIGDTVSKNEDYQLNENEAYISLHTLNSYFGTKYKANDLFDLTAEAISSTSFKYNATIKMIPKELGSTIDVTLRNRETGEIMELNNIKIKGVIISDAVEGKFDPETNKFNVYFVEAMDTTYVKTTLYMNDNGIYEKAQDYGRSDKLNVWVKTDSVKNLKSVLHTYESSLSTPASYAASHVMRVIKPLIGLLKILTVVFTIITFCVIVLTISLQVKNRTHELAVFKALGAQNKDLSKIYLFEMVMIATPTSILSILGAWGATWLVNNDYTTGLFTGLKLLYFDWVNIPLIICFNFAFVFAAIIIPLIKIIKLNIIDAIKIN